MNWESRHAVSSDRGLKTSTICLLPREFNVVRTSLTASMTAVGKRMLWPSPGSTVSAIDAAFSQRCRVGMRMCGWDDLVVLSDHQPHDGVARDVTRQLQRLQT